MSHHHTAHLPELEGVNHLWVDPTTTQYAHVKPSEFVMMSPKPTPAGDGSYYYIFGPNDENQADSSTIIFAPSLKLDVGSALTARHVQGAMDVVTNNLFDVPRARALLVPGVSAEVAEYANKCASIVKSILINRGIGSAVCGVARMSEGPALLASATRMADEGIQIGSLTFIEPSLPSGDIRLPLNLEDTHNVFKSVRRAVRGSRIKVYEKEEHVRHGRTNWYLNRLFDGKIDKSVKPFKADAIENDASEAFTSQLEAFSKQHPDTAVSAAVGEKCIHSLLTKDAVLRFRGTNVKLDPVKYGLVSMNPQLVAIKVIETHKRGLDLRRDRSIQSDPGVTPLVRPY